MSDTVARETSSLVPNSFPVLWTVHKVSKITFNFILNTFILKILDENIQIEESPHHPISLKC